MGGRDADRPRQARRSTGRRPESTRSSTARSRVGRLRAAGRRRTAAFGLGLSTTRRAAVFAIVVCALALSVAVPLRTYLSQRTEVEAQQHRKAELQAQVDALERRKAQLADPAQVEAEARRRLRYVMPGETPYMVELPEDGTGQSSGQPTQQPQPQHAWYQGLWNSVTGG